MNLHGRCLFAAAVCVLLAGPVARADQPAANESLREFAKRNQKRYACGFYLAGIKIGWGVEETRLGKHNGKEALIAQSDAEISMVLFGQRHTMRMQEKAVYELEGQGLLVYSEEREDEDGNVTLRTARREGDRLVITTQTEGDTSSRTTPLSKDTIDQTVKIEQWLKGPPRKGDTFDLYELDLEHAEGPDDKMVLKYLRRRPLRWSGVRMMCHDVETEIEGMAVQATALADGTFLRGKMGPLDIRLEEEEVAKDFKARVLDMAFQIPVDRDLGDSKTLDALTLKSTIKCPIPQSHRQSFQDEGSATVLTIKRDFRVEQAQPLSEKDRQKYLKATAEIQCDDPKIRRLARKISGDEKDPLAVAERLQRWVFENIVPAYNQNASQSLKVLKNKAGDCTEHALLFVTLARSAGIPAREVAGLVYANEAKPYFAWHAWAEIHDGTQWVSVDPTWDQMWVDAGHIKLSRGEDDFGWMSLVGSLKLNVVDVRRKE